MTPSAATMPRPISKPVLPRDLKPTIRKLSNSTKYRLTCPVMGCGVLGYHDHRASAARAFDEHCDEVHPAPTPLHVACAAVPLTQVGTGRWVCEPVPGRQFTVQQTAQDRFVLSTGIPTAAVHGPTIRSLAAARLCIAQMTQAITSSQAEAARLQLERRWRQGLVP